MTSPAHLDHLLRELRGRYAIPRKNAADALVQIGAAAVPGLITILRDKNPDARQTAADTLERIGTPDALAALETWRNEQAQA